MQVGVVGAEQQAYARLSTVSIGVSDDSFGVHTPTLIGDLAYESLGHTTVAFTPRCR